MSWVPEQWENYCKRLFAARHGVSYQSVPDMVRGDWGIEGYTSDGTLYQCYAPEDSRSSQDLYEKQRSKITTDLAKLVANSEAIALLVQPCEVCIWVLVVPLVEDKRILSHGANKAAELRGSNHSFISSDFAVRVLTDADFEAERITFGEQIWAELPNSGLLTEDAIRNFADGPDTNVAALDAKLAKLTAGQSASELGTLRSQMLRLYLAGKQRDDLLRHYHPAIWDEWHHARSGIETTLPTAQLVAGGEPSAHLGTVVDELTRVATAAIPRLRPGDTNVLVHGTIAEWLFDCPLNFT